MNEAEGDAQTVTGTQWIRLGMGCNIMQTNAAQALQNRIAIAAQSVRKRRDISAQSNFNRFPFAAKSLRKRSAAQRVLL
jgi:translation initiation factor 1 (eIF-1/SUI1)